MTVFATGSRARTMDFETGDVGYIQKTLPRYIENTGSTDLKFLEMFKSSYYQDLALSEWLSHTPPELVAAHLNLDKPTSTRCRARKRSSFPDKWRKETYGQSEPRGLGFIDFPKDLHGFSFRDST